MSNVRWYAAWAVVVAVLIALPVAALLTHDDSADIASGTNPFLVPSASPTPSPSAAPSEETASAAPSGAAPSLSDVPLCANVWQDGRVLPAGYQGCQRSGAVVKPKRQRCLVSYQDSWWAKPGQEVRAAGDGLSKDKRYTEALAHCS